MQYIITAIRRNAGKADYIWLHEYENGRPVTFDNECDAADRLNTFLADTKFPMYGGRVIGIPETA